MFLLFLAKIELEENSILRNINMEIAISAGNSSEQGTLESSRALVGDHLELPAHLPFRIITTTTSNTLLGEFQHNHQRGTVGTSFHRTCSQQGDSSPAVATHKKLPQRTPLLSPEGCLNKPSLSYFFFLSVAPVVVKCLC